MTLNFTFEVTKVKSMGAVGLPIMTSYIVLNTNKWPNSALFTRYKPPKSLCIDFHLSRSLKVKSNGVGGFPIYDFLLVFKSNTLSKSKFLTWAIIACYRKLRDAFVSQMKDLCLSFICTKNKPTGYCALKNKHIYTCCVTLWFEYRSVFSGQVRNACECNTMLKCIQWASKECM